jgi:hypothetical protein
MLKDGTTVFIRRFQEEDKERLFQMYESLSDETVRWGMPPYTNERIERGWLSGLQNVIAFVVRAKHHDELAMGLIL